METIIITRLADLKAGDRLVSFGGTPYQKPLVVQSPLGPIEQGSPVHGVRITPPEGSGIDWIFYPSQMDGYGMTIERRSQ